MTNEVNSKAAFEPPFDCRVGQRIKRYLRQLAPHQNEREGPQLMREALAEIERLRDWIRHDSEVNDICTFHVLGEICQGCGCPRKVPNA